MVVASSFRREVTPDGAQAELLETRERLATPPTLGDVENGFFVRGQTGSNTVKQGRWTTTAFQD